MCETSFKNMSQQSNHNFKSVNHIIFRFISLFVLPEFEGMCYYYWANCFELDSFTTTWAIQGCTRTKQWLFKKGNSHSGNAICSPMVKFYIKHNVNCQNANVQDVKNISPKLLRCVYVYSKTFSGWSGELPSTFDASRFILIPTNL